MGGHDRCCVGPCNNDKRFPNRMVVRGHVHQVLFHRFPKDEKEKNIWVQQISRGRVNFVAGPGARVCSNHFEGNHFLYISLHKPYKCRVGTQSHIQYAINFCLFNFNNSSKPVTQEKY